MPPSISRVTPDIRDERGKPGATKRLSVRHCACNYLQDRVLSHFTGEETEVD